MSSQRFLAVLLTAVCINILYFKLHLRRNSKKSNMFTNPFSS